jgi:hypothetical protein
MIKPDHWPDFMKQISDFTYRPILRALHKADKPAPTHKFVHATNTVVLYQRHLNKNKPNRLKSKKQSASLISRNFDSIVFGQHDDTRVLVGMIFNANLCTVKARIAYDRGTYARGWVGDEQKVLTYKESMTALNFTDEQLFAEHVAQNPNKVNEALIQFSQEAVKTGAIVLVKDSKASRDMAFARQAQLKKLGLDLMVIVYDPLIKSIKPCLAYSAVDYITNEIEAEKLIHTVMHRSLPMAVNVACQALIKACLDKQLAWSEVMKNMQKVINNYLSTLEMEIVGHAWKPTFFERWGRGGLPSEAKQIIDIIKANEKLDLLQQVDNLNKIADQMKKISSSSTQSAERKIYYESLTKKMNI